MAFVSFRDHSVYPVDSCACDVSEVIPSRGIFENQFPTLATPYTVTLPFSSENPNGNPTVTSGRYLPSGHLQLGKMTTLRYSRHPQGMNNGLIWPMEIVARCGGNVRFIVRQNSRVTHRRMENSWSRGICDTEGRIYCEAIHPPYL